MTAVVRLFAYSGFSAAFFSNNNSQQINGSGHPIFKEPYLGSESITANTGTAQSTTSALTPSSTTIVRVQVDPGKRVHYECTPRGQTARTATANSPIMEGNDVLEAGPGWTISLLEVT